MRLGLERGQGLQRRRLSHAMQSLPPLPAPANGTLVVSPSRRPQQQQNLLFPCYPGAASRVRSSKRLHVGGNNSLHNGLPELTASPCVAYRTSRLVSADAAAGSGSGSASGELQEKRVGSAEAAALLLPDGLSPEALPRHVAVIMDGNARWARARGLPVSAGHEAGYRSLKQMVKLSRRWGIRVLTVFAFSSENWLRPKAEVDFLMMLFEGVLRENIGDFLREGIRICVIGDSSKLPNSLQKLAREVEKATRNNSQLDLIVAVSYSGRRDIVRACQRIADKVKNKLVDPEDITELLFAQELETNCTTDYPYPDLLIRTSGELRLSNFLLWQSAYTELFFTRTQWPDFGEIDYLEALCSFKNRERRFGQRDV
ncbi:Dehydrodolichyl diphosphate synthase 2 [Ananas comosus]|uniref:Alkyl transferase n=1 Tax=Ananas comosus TaxID=4615 RepID=A0A199V6M1_ANACO|nr:Dehydrodolichyl diphosphate synthase 2 [Ananas comosus]